jgi:serine/threonine protein phosphatase PrpC
MGEIFNQFDREKKERVPESPYPFRTVQLLGPREAQQDYFDSKVILRDGRKIQVNIVADGHGKGGEFYAYRAAESIISSIEKFTGEIGEKEFEDIFNDADIDSSEIVKRGGTTMSVVILEEGHISGAYVGDSEAKLVGSHGIISNLTPPHHLRNEDEFERVISEGGNVFKGRIIVNGSGINLTRAIGDHDFKPFIIPKPNTFSLKIQPSDKYLVVASDGFWEVGEGFNLEKEKLGEILAATKSIDEAEDVVKTFLAERRQKDNITVQIIELNKKSSA